MDFNDISTSKVDSFFAHHGVEGQKWGLRRYQNKDGTLTPAGRARYLKGGRREIKRAEKERRKAEKAQERRERILNDRKKLYKHRDEFSKEEIDAAMQRFASQDQLKRQMDDEKARRQQAKEATAKAKLDYKSLKLKAKMEKLKAKEQQKQSELQTQQSEIQTQQKKDTADLSTKADLWKKRTEKLKSVIDFAKAGKSILDDMGITSKDGSDSLFGALAESLGIKDLSAKKAAEEAKKARAEETEKLNLEKLRWQVEQTKQAALKLRPQPDASKEAKAEVKTEMKTNEHEIPKSAYNFTPNAAPSSTTYNAKSSLAKSSNKGYAKGAADLAKDVASRYLSGRRNVEQKTNWSEEMLLNNGFANLPRSKKRKDGEWDKRFSFKGLMTDSTFANVSMEDVFKILNAKGVL